MSNTSAGVLWGPWEWNHWKQCWERSGVSTGNTVRLSLTTPLQLNQPNTGT